MSPVPEFYQRLRLQRTGLLWLLLVVLAFSVFGVFSILVLIADAANAISSWQESTAFATVLALTIVSAVGFIGGGIFALIKRPSLGFLAQIIESRHSDLRESLSTAVELQEQHDGPRNDLEAALFRSVEERTAELNFRTATLPPKAHPLAMIGIVIASFVLSNWAADSVVMAKARFHYADMITGESTGLVVEPGSVDAPRKSDLLIEAEVNRWQAEAEIDYRGADGLVETYPMAMTGERAFDFTWYSLEQSFEYRVRTPSLESAWQRVTVYDPPEIDSIEIHVEPPAYTGEPNLNFSRLLDLFVVEGSAIEFQLTTPSDVETWLRVGDEETAFDGAITMNAERTTEYQFRLRNQAGREAVTERYLLEVKPDEPPTVAIIEPGSDSKAILDDIVPLEVYAGDDYGISRMEVEISVSGLPRSPLTIFSRDSDHPVEHTSLPAIEVGRLGVEFGDVITYFAKAWDNREPEPQVGRSEIYFIEVVENIDGPDQEQQDSADSEGGESREQDVDIRALITELKRLIRLAYKVDLETGERRTLGSQDLGANLSKLATEAQGILGQVGAVLGRIDEGLPYEMFLDAVYRMVDAEEFANANQPADAIIPMQESMSLLIRLEKYLEALFPPEPQSGGGGSGQSQSQASGQSEEEQSGESESGMSMAEMQEALEEINRISDEQAAANRRFERSPSQMSETERAELQTLQEAVEEKVDALTDELSKLRQGGSVRDALRSAGGQMNEASSAAGQGDADRAGRAGFRARRSLMDAAGLLDERIRREATSAIAGLAQQAERMAQSQEAAAAESRGAAQSGVDDDRKETMQDQQRALNEEWTRLEREMDDLTGSLSKVFPEAADALAAVARRATQENIDREMSRAANALLYERFERAAGSQSSAAEALADVAGDLDQAAGTLPGLSPTELRELLERVADARREVALNESSGQSPGEGEGESAEGQSGDGEGQGEQAGQGGEGGQGSEGQQGQMAQNGQGGQGQSPGQSGESGEGQEAGEAQAGGSAQGQASSESDALGQLGDSLSRAGRALKDQSLVELGSELRAPQGGDGAGSGTSPAAVLDSAARVLQEYLRQQIGDQRLRFNREGGPPPEKYRELVEEYFRDLAEEPSR